MCQAITYNGLKATENFVIPKVTAIVYEGWSFMGGSNYVRALTGRICCFGSVVAYGRSSLT